jgi:hypothetical protein
MQCITAYCKKRGGGRKGAYLYNIGLQGQAILIVESSQFWQIMQLPFSGWISVGDELGSPYKDHSVGVEWEVTNVIVWAET